MDNTELVVPPSSSHWSLRFVDIRKPFPSHIMANTTYKVIRFFYPPFALEAVNVTHEVSNPELNALNVFLLLGFSLFAAGAVYAGYKYYLKVKPLARQSAERLLESEPRTKSEHGSEYKLGNWERKDVSDPLLAGKGQPYDDNLDLPRKSSNVIEEAQWLPDSIDNSIDGDSSVQSDKGNATFPDEVRCRAPIDLDGDKQGDLAEQINRAVWESYIPKIRENP